MNNPLALNAGLGQVWTPSAIACEMAREALNAHPHAKHVLDPACGPATFSTALHEMGASAIVLTCYDIDSRMQQETASKNHQFGFKGRTVTQDYLADTSIAGNYDLVIMNPPYIRQELIPKNLKESYHQYIFKSLGERIDKRSNLFVLFLLKGIVDLAQDGVMCAIVFDAITQSSYGKKALSILERHAELLSSRSVKAPFDNVLVDAQILLYRKRLAPVTKLIDLQESTNSTDVSLETLLKVRRGTALPLRKAYLASASDPYYENSSPFFIKQSKLNGLVVTADERVYLADPHKLTNEAFKTWLKERVIANNLPASKSSINPVRGPIAFNYYIRKSPRHLWNADNVALADNFYVATPSEDFPADAAWLLLNSDLYLNRLVESARSQGNGLLKLQLFEYKRVFLPDWRNLTENEIKILSKTAQNLISEGAKYDIVRQTANKITKGLLHD